MYMKLVGQHFFERNALDTITKYYVAIASAILNNIRNDLPQFVCYFSLQKPVENTEINHKTGHLLV